MTGRLKGTPRGWKNFNRECPKCARPIERYRRVCKSCGQRVENYCGKVYPL